MDVTILQAIQISVWCLFTLRETVIISKTTHIKEKGATASGFTPLGPCKTDTRKKHSQQINLPVACLTLFTGFSFVLVEWI